METHLVGTQNLRAQLGDHLSVDGDDACLDELVGLATAANAGIGEELVQTQRFVGIIVNLLILNAFLHRVLGIGIVVGRAGTLAVGLLAILSLLTIRLLAILLVGLVAVGGTMLVATLTGLIATLLLTGLVATHVAILVIARTIAALLLTGLVATLATFLAVAGTVATLRLTRLVATLAVIVVTGTVTAWLTAHAALLKSGAETFGTETALVAVLSVVTGAVAAVIGGTLPGVDTGTW